MGARLCLAFGALGSSWSAEMSVSKASPADSDGSCISRSRGVVPGDQRELLQCAVGDAVQLRQLVGHGEEGYVWSGKHVPSEREVVVKFRCHQEACQGGTVSLQGPDKELIGECYAGSEAFRRAPGRVSGCFEDPPADAQFIVLQKVPASYVLLDNSEQDFVQADKQSNHGLSRQLLKTIRGFLDPVDGRSLIHDDLTSANIMWDKGSLNLTVIDFSQAEICSHFTWSSQNCEAKLLLKDVKKELIYWALRADFHGHARADTCSRRATKINFELRAAARVPADVFVGRHLGDCAEYVSDWTWSLLAWTSAVDAELARQLGGGAELVPIVALWKDLPDAPWSLSALDRLAA